MIAVAWTVLMVAGTALAWRLRGHRLGDGWIGSNAVNRAIWATWAAFAMGAGTGGPWWAVVLAWIGGYIAAIMGHRSYMPAGVDRPRPIDGNRHEGHALIFMVLPWDRWSDLRIDLVGLAWTGAARGLLIGVWWGWEVAGLAMAGGVLGHVAGYAIGGRIEWPGRLDWIERGELLAGALMGLGLAATPLLGL